MHAGTFNAWAPGMAATVAETTLARLAAADRHLGEMPLDPDTLAQLAEPHLRQMVKLAMVGFAADSIAEAFRAFAEQQRGNP